LTYAGKFYENSDVAVLLLGDSENVKLVSPLRDLRGSATELITPVDSALNRNAIRVERACWMALLKLGDGGARRELDALLRGDAVEGRVRAVEGIQYAGRPELAALLLPLLDDRRVGERPFSSIDYKLLVRDLAATTARAVLGRCNFHHAQFTRYTDEEIEYVRALIRRETGGRAARP